MLNVAGRAQGWSDAPLTPNGALVAEALGRGLRREGITFDGVYTSDTTRARETADRVLNASGQPDLLDSLVADWRLREANFGSFEGMSGRELFEILAEHEGMSVPEFKQFAESNREGHVVHLTDTLAELDRKQGGHKTTWPAERYEDIADRAIEAIGDISATAESNGSGKMLVIAHALTISILLEQLGAADRVPAAGLPNASVSTLRYAGGTYEVREVGDTRFARLGET